MYQGITYLPEGWYIGGCNRRFLDLGFPYDTRRSKKRHFCHPWTPFRDNLWSLRTETSKGKRRTSACLPSSRQ